MSKTLRLTLLETIGLTILLATPVFAQTVVNFGAAASCPTYCTGFTTDNPDVTVDWINSWYNGSTIMSVNGVVHSGPAAFEVTSSCGTRCYIEQETDVPLHAADGSSILATIVMKQTTVYVSSGRAHYYLTRRYVLGGSLTIP